MENVQIRSDILETIGLSFDKSCCPVVCIQGLGHVGIAMAAAVANSQNTDGNQNFNVVGIELCTSEGRKKVAAVNLGKCPVETTDVNLRTALQACHSRGNLVATHDTRAYGAASVVIVDIPLDVVDISGAPSVLWPAFTEAIGEIGDHLSPGALILVETTVPPGTCEKVILPELEDRFRRRGLDEKKILIAHSYERVMPGVNYYDSVTNYWRVFAGVGEDASRKCEEFLNKIINVSEFPLTQLHSVTASETAKILENSYRAVNIAFIDEFSRFAETVGIDLFEVIDAIRIRPTHSNIMRPGFGVGGYCLTKDPIMASIGGVGLFSNERCSDRNL